jgi:serine/threonine-protein kinase
MNAEYRSGDPIPGTQYRFVREIGAGGHGSVYLVEHTFLESQAVMKLLHGDLVARGDIAARMTREARTLAKLRHPNVVEVRDGGLTDEAVSRPYFVMEQLNGMALREMLRRTHGGLGVLPALRIVTDILIGLDHAHNAGVIHRDIKPENVFLHRAQSAMTVAKILDFGIAHLLLGQRLTGRYFLGTPRYAAPEQLRSETPTARTDIYAAGLVLHELLTGEAPFSKLKDIGAILNAHLNTALPKPSLSAPDVPLSLDRFIDCMLAKDPADRPPTAFAAAVALREIRSRLEAEQSTTIHSPEFKTEPSPMEDVLYAASPDHRPIITEVAPPLGIHDTTPDLAPNHQSSVRPPNAGSGESSSAPSSTTEPSPGIVAAPPRLTPQNRTVPLAPAVKADAETEPDLSPRPKPFVDRAARTNTAPARGPTARRGSGDTTPMDEPDAGGAFPRASLPGSTTSQPLVVSHPAPLVPAHADAGARNAARAQRKKRLFAAKVLATALALGGATATLTTVILHAARDSSAAAPPFLAPEPTHFAPAAPPAPPTKTAPSIHSATPTPTAPATAPPTPARRPLATAPPPPSAIPFD